VCHGGVACNLKAGIYYAQAEADGQVTYTIFGGPAQVFGKDTGQQSDPFTEFADTGNIGLKLGTAQAFGQGTVLAGPGQVSAYATAQSSINAVGGGKVHVNATASMFDNLLFTTLGPMGQTLHIATHWNITGHIGGSASDPNPDETATSAGSYLGLWGTAFGDAHGTQDSAILESSAGYDINSIQNLGSENQASASIPVTITVQTGLFFPLGATMQVIAVSSTSSDGTNPQNANSQVTADYAHTLAWGGIDSVTDDNGNPVTGWSVTSDSGFDYSKPYNVPEPASFALLAVALPVVLTSRRLFR
jgi:hypothetical protein